MGVSDAIRYDPCTFRKHFKDIGRAYREQATTLIEMCRLYVDASPQTYIEDDDLQNIFRLADAALSAAAKANKKKTSEATDAFLRVQEEMERFGSPPPRKGSDSPGDHRKRLPDPRIALATASEKDEQSTKSFLSKIMKSKSPAPVSKGPTVKVNFVILKSPHERRHDQLIVRQEINNSTTASEIIWRFSRYPKNYPERITPKQNPHFYLQLSNDAASYDSKFKKGPLKDFAYRLHPEDTIYVLLDKSCRLFLDAAPPYIPRIFGNLWKPHRTVILKDVVGNLESEDHVLSGIGESQEYWHRTSRVADPSLGRVESGYSGIDGKIVAGSGRAVVNAALSVQNVDLMIRDRSLPEPSTDWKPLPSSEPSSRVQKPEEETTPKQSAMALPQPENTNPNASNPSFGGSTLFDSSTSTESLETAVNTSDASLPRGAPAAGRPTQPERPKVLTENVSSRSLSTAPPGDLMMPPPLPGSWHEPEPEPQSAPPLRTNRLQKWFRAYIYDYDS